MKITKEIEIELNDCNFRPKDIADYLFNCSDSEVDIEFLNRYFYLERWTNDKEIAEIAEDLTDGTIKIMKKIVKAAKISRKKCMCHR